MIARFDHRPMLTAVLALTTTMLFVVVVTLTTLLLTAAPPAAVPSSGSVGGHPGATAAAPSNMGDVYAAGWNNYGHNVAIPPPAQEGNGADSAIDRQAEVVAAYGDNR
jgi:hypothetical protein